jgi:MFS family permease
MKKSYREREIAMGRKFSFWSVAYTILILMVGTNIPSPLYSVYKEDWRFSSLILTLIFATYALILIPSLALFGRISDKYGRKKVIWLGVFMSVLGSLAFIFAKSIAWLFIARAFQGLAVGILSGAATAALMELNPSEEKKLAALITSAATAGGTALGPLVGGIIAEYGLFPKIMPFIAHLVLVIPSIIGVLMMDETVLVKHNEVKKTGKTSMPSDIRKPFIASAITAFIAWSVTALFMSIIPSYVSSLLHIKNLAITGGVVFLMLGSSVLIQFIMKKLNHYLSMKSGITFLTVGLLSLVIAVPIQSLVLLLIGTIITGIGQGLSFKGAMELVNNIAPTDQRGMLVSKLYVVIYLGVGIPIIGIGTLAVILGLFKAIFIFTCIITIITIIMLGAGYKRLSSIENETLHTAQLMR